MLERVLPDWVVKRVNGPKQKTSLVTEALGELKKSESNLISSQNIIGNLFWPIVFMLKVTGHSPLSYYTEEDESTNIVVDIKTESKSIFQITRNDPKSFQQAANEQQEEVKPMKYGFVFKSPFFIWTLVVAIFFPYNQISAILGYASIHGSSWWENLMSIAKEMANKAGTESQGPMISILTSIKLLEIIIPITHLMELILSWKESTAFAHFLNNWQSFQSEFSLVFPPSIDPVDAFRFTKRRNFLLIFYVLCPTFILLITAAVIIMQGSILMFCLHILMITPFVLETAAATLLEDMKAVMSYMALANAFLQIRNGMRHSQKWEKLTSARVRSWRKLVYQIREQVELAGTYQKNHQLLLLFMSIVEATTLSFVVLNSNWFATTMDSLHISGQCLAYILVLVGRFYLKILAADKITRNEALIALELENMDTTDTEYSTQLEIKFLHGIIKQKPIMISFGNYVTLNKQLLLGTAAQVVTYLIVLMQFSQAKSF